MALLLGGLALALVLGTWFLWRRAARVPCTLDLESTHDHLHAHLILEGFAPDPGDAVAVHDAPDRLEVGEIRTLRSEAVVHRASWLRRKWTRLVGRFGVHELWDVGFE